MIILNNKCSSCFQVFVNFKHSTRHKAQIILEDINGTGGGPSKSSTLTEVEERALNLWGLVAIDGIKNGETIGIPSEPAKNCEEEIINLEEYSQTIPSTNNKENIATLNPPKPSNPLKRKRGLFT